MHKKQSLKSTCFRFSFSDAISEVQGEGPRRLSNLNNSWSYACLVYLPSKPPVQATLVGNLVKAGSENSSSASLGLTDCSQIDMLGVRHKIVNFGAEKSPVSPSL